MAKRFDKDPKKPESEDSCSESEDSEMETLPEEVEEEADRQKKKLLTRRHRSSSSGASGSGASTSTSTPTSDIYAPPTAATGAIPKNKSGLYGTGPPEWDSRTPSPFVQQFRDPKTGRQNWPAMQKRYELENQRAERQFPGEASGKTPEARGKWLALKSRYHTSQAEESGKKSRQVELLKGKLGKGFAFVPQGKKESEGRFLKTGFTPSASRPWMQPQDPNREEDYARFSQKVKEMDKSKKVSAILPTGRMGYGPPSAADTNQRSEPMDDFRAFIMKRQFGQQETPQYWRPRDTDFAERLTLVSKEDRKAYTNYRQMANMAANRPASHRLTPFRDYSERDHSRRRVKEYRHEARKNFPMERGGRRDQLYQRSALPPAELYQRSPDTPPEPKLKDFEMGAISEYYPFEPFSEDPLTPRPSWPPRMPEDQVRPLPSATYTPMSSGRRRFDSGTDSSDEDVGVWDGTPGLVQPLDPFWHRSPPSPVRLATGAQTIEMAPQSRAPTPSPSASSLARRSPTSSPRRSGIGDPIQDKSEESEEEKE